MDRFPYETHVLSILLLESINYYTLMRETISYMTSRGTQNLLVGLQALLTVHSVSGSNVTYKGTSADLQSCNLFL